MEYIVNYEICALLFLVVVTVRFFAMRRFKDRANRIFGIVLYCALVNIALDIIGSYTIKYSQYVPELIIYAVNSLFYILQIALPAIMLLYVFVLAGYEMPKKRKILCWIPAILGEILLVLNPFTKIIFYLEKTESGITYMHGNMFNALYACSVLYMILTLFAALSLRHSLRRTEIRTIVSFILIIAAALVIQMLIPNVLLTGVAMSVAVLMMFLTLQNPETMLDSITGMFNYSALIIYLRKQIADGTSLWITTVDVGGIRRVNSSLGIHSGNELLEKIGVYLNAICGNHATAFRMMGTRLIIISDNAGTHKDIVNKVTERFKEAWICNDSEILLLATVRYCEEKHLFSSPEDVISLVDIAYSKVASEGYGTTRPIDGVQFEQFRRRDRVKEAIANALSSGTGFYMEYQPLYSVVEKKFCGAEALLRLNDPVLGKISPAEFIPVAENTEMMYQIDSMVVSMASGLLKSHPELLDNGLKLMQINLSATEFNNNTDKLYNDIASSIDTIEKNICFEVTETAVTSRREVLSDFMYRLINKGVKFAIDDFGTGYANITQLAKLPFSVVKLDKLFATKSDDREPFVLRDIVNMFSHMGLSTVFEGVETSAQAEYAADLGVGQIQGFYYSRPVSGEELVAIMGAQSNSEVSA